MKKATALTAAENYAAEWGVPWGDEVEIKDRTPWWTLFTTTDLTLTFESDQGTGEAGITSPGEVIWFAFHPTDPDQIMVPLWAAYPSYNAVTIGWRMGNGETYRAMWRQWYASLDAAEREVYKRRFPPPDDDRGWQDFYEFLEEALE